MVSTVSMSFTPFTVVITWYIPPTLTLPPFPYIYYRLTTASKYCPSVTPSPATTITHIEITPTPLSLSTVGYPPPPSSPRKEKHPHHTTFTITTMTAMPLVLSQQKTTTIRVTPRHHITSTTVPSSPHCPSHYKPLHPSFDAPL